MMTRSDLCPMIIEALRASSGRSTIIQICKYIWDHYEQKLLMSGDFFYIWQYEMRWAKQELIKNGKLKRSRKGIWELT